MIVSRGVSDAQRLYSIGSGLLHRGGVAHSGRPRSGFGDLRHHRYRRCDRGVLSCRRRHLPRRQRESTEIRCLVQSTGGSIDNIARLRAGELQFGFAQSDWRYHAFHGTDRFSEYGPFEDLRAVFSLHAEPFTIVARADADVSQLDDLKGKRVNIGNPGSGQRATMDVVLAAKGWSLADFAEALELTSAEQSEPCAPTASMRS